MSNLPNSSLLDMSIVEFVKNNEVLDDVKKDHGVLCCNTQGNYLGFFII